MLSILIPVYNYNISKLTKEVHSQLVVAGIPFEILCLDDHSTLRFDENNALNDLEHCAYTVLDKNVGRSAIRNLLAEKATYETLLFLDADTLPVRDNFIKTYLKYVDSDYEAVFGGIAYENNTPSQQQLLRWTYGKRNESKKANLRNKQPYTSITSPNFLVRKSVFTAIHSRIQQKAYGNDVYFAKLMREANIKVLHIDNEVYHLGLEESEVYLHKSEAALQTYLTLLQQGTIAPKDNRLVKTFTTLKAWKLNHILNGFYNSFKNPMKRNLLGNCPSIRVFQLYRLSYLCHIDSAKN